MFKYVKIDIIIFLILCLFTLRLLDGEIDPWTHNLSIIWFLKYSDVNLRTKTLCLTILTIYSFNNQKTIESHSEIKMLWRGDCPIVT